MTITQLAQLIAGTRNPGNRATHMLLPEEVTGYAFDAENSWWAVVVPEETENLIRNPSFEVPLVTGMYQTNGVNLTWTRESTSPVGPVSGLYNLKLQHSGSAPANFSYRQEGTGTPVTPGPYTFSAYIYVTKPPVTLSMQVWNYAVGFPVMAQKSFVLQGGGWQRLELTYVVLGSSSHIPNIRFTDSPSSTVTYYLDALQFEKKAYATTYADGDMLGWFDTSINQSYYWRGAPHNSTSVRRARTGSGGRIVGLSDKYKFYTTGIVGLGMNPVALRTVQMSDGSEIIIGTNDQARDFTITGKIYAQDYKQLGKTRQELIELLRPNKTPGREPLVLRYYPIDSDGKPYGIPLEIVCAYTEGLQGNITNFYQETIGLQFRASDPFLYKDIDSAKALSLYKNLDYDHVMYRDNTGNWSMLDLNFASVTAIAGIDWDYQGNVIIAGNFNDGASFPILNVAKYENGTWVEINDSSLSGFNSDILCLETSRNFYDNIMMVGGNFTNLDGANCGYIARFSPDVNEFNPIESAGAAGLNGRVRDIKRGADGYFYICGDFSGRRGTTPTNNFHASYLGGVCRYNPKTDTLEKMGGTSGGASGGFIYSVLPANDGYVYAAGNFTGVYNSAGVLLSSNPGVVRWNSVTNEWELMGTGIDEINGLVYRLLYGQDGAIYAVGDFTKSGTGSTSVYDLRGFARWNGGGWEEVFDLNALHKNNVPASTHFLDCKIDHNGIFWFWGKVGVQFDVPGFGKQYMFGWRNGIFYPQPFWVNSGSASSVARIGNAAFGPEGEMLVGINAQNTGSNPHIHVPAHHVVEYGGNADGKPEFSMQNAMRLVSIENFSLGEGIYFREDGALGNGEIVRLRTGTQPQVISNARTNAKRIVNVGPSAMSKFRLAPGTNYISVFARNVDNSATSYVKWRNRFYSIDAAS